MAKITINQDVNLGINQTDAKPKTSTKPPPTADLRINYHGITVTLRLRFSNAPRDGHAHANRP